MESRVRKTRYDIITAQPSRILECVLLSSTLLNLETHWDRHIGKKGRTVPCLGEGACAYCAAHLGSDPKCYAAAQMLHSDLLFILQMSDGGSIDLQLAVKGKRDLRGAKLRCTRDGRRENSRMHVELLGWGDPTRLADPFDIRPDVERSFGLRAGLAQQERNRQPHPETTRRHRRGR